MLGVGVGWRWVLGWLEVGVGVGWRWVLGWLEVGVRVVEGGCWGGLKMG